MKAASSGAPFTAFDRVIPYQASRTGSVIDQVAPGTADIDLTALTALVISVLPALTIPDTRRPRVTA